MPIIPGVKNFSVSQIKIPLDNPPSIPFVIFYKIKCIQILSGIYHGSDVWPLHEISSIYGGHSVVVVATLLKRASKKSSSQQLDTLITHSGVTATEQSH